MRMDQLFFDVFSVKGFPYLLSITSTHTMFYSQPQILPIVENFLNNYSEVFLKIHMRHGVLFWMKRIGQLSKCDINTKQLLIALPQSKVKVSYTWQHWWLLSKLICLQSFAREFYENKKL